jgi:putative acetyltransferase
VIRSATPADREAIIAVTDAAFEGEAQAMRIIREFDPEISLVWDEDGEIRGHTALTRMRMGDHRPFQLSPVSVAPAHQGRGIGSALVREALRQADELGEPFVLVLGIPAYYPRFGFELAAPLGVLPPQDFGAAWMLARLSAYDPSFTGTVEFPPPFD